jgi:hypothetical protein
LLSRPNDALKAVICDGALVIDRLPREQTSTSASWHSPVGTGISVGG